MAMRGNAHDVGLSYVQPKIDLLRVNRTEIAAILRGEDPECCLGAASPRVDRRFSQKCIAHGFYRETSLHGESEGLRRKERLEKRRLLQLEHAMSSFDREAATIKRIQSRLAKKQTVKKSDMAQSLASTLIQNQARLMLARLFTVNKRRFRAGLLLAYWGQARHRFRRKRKAAGTIRRMFFHYYFGRVLATRVLESHAAVILQLSVRRVQAVKRTKTHKIARAAAKKTVQAVIYFGFARAQAALVAPHRAACLIQMRYRKRLRRRRIRERRQRRQQKLYGKQMAIRALGVKGGNDRGTFYPEIKSPTGRNSYTNINNPATGTARALIGDVQLMINNPATGQLPRASDPTGEDDANSRGKVSSITTCEDENSLLAYDPTFGAGPGGDKRRQSPLAAAVKPRGSRRELRKQQTPPNATFVTETIPPADLKRGPPSAGRGLKTPPANNAADESRTPRPPSADKPLPASTKQRRYSNPLVPPNTS